jgi:hypothetical protein
VSLHKQRTHPGADVPGCFGCRVSGVQVATAPTNDARRAAYEGQHAWAAEFHNGDREAYRRLRQQGLQPPRIAGSAHLERHAETRFEVESGRIDPNTKALSQALSVAADVGIDPLKAVTTPTEAS